MRRWLVVLIVVSLLTSAAPKAEAGDFVSDAGIGIATCS